MTSHRFGASTGLSQNVLDFDFDLDNTQSNTQEYNTRMTPYIKPMEEPNTNINALFLPGAMNFNQDPFTFEENGSPFDLEGHEEEEQEKDGENVSKIHQGIMKMKPLAAPKFSIKKHLRTSYYNKRR